MDKSLKQRILEKISATDDEDLLSMVMEDIGLYETAKITNNGLTQEDFDELRELATEPHDKDTTSFDKFKELYTNGVPTHN